MKTVHNNRFTLIELLIVITIIGLILGIALPSLGKFPAGILTRRTISDIEGAFTKARLTALASGATAAVKFDFESSRVAIIPGKSNNNYPQMLHRAQNPELEELDEEATTKKPTLFYPIKFSLHNGVKIKPHDEDFSEYVDLEEESNRYAYEFYADGEAFGPVLELNIGTKKYDIEVDNLTGKAVITPQEEN